MHLMSLALTILTSAACLVAAQQPTIPEALTRAGTSLAGGTNIPSGPPVAIADFIDEVDVIVAGTVKRSASYLSDDKVHVYTDFELHEPRVLFQAQGHSLPGRGLVPTLTITLWGGTVTLDGLSFTEEHELLPLLPDGTDGVFLLSHDGNRYFLAGKLYGAFGISQGRIRPLARKAGFASEYTNAEIKAFVDAIAALRSQKRR